MTRAEAIALIRPFMPTNPTHPSTHVSIPLEALKVLLKDAAGLHRLAQTAYAYRDGDKDRTSRAGAWTDQDLQDDKDQWEALLAAVHGLEDV